MGVVTTPEITEALQSGYWKILYEPVITVELSNFEKPYFICEGGGGKSSRGAGT